MHYYSRILASGALIMSSISVLASEPVIRPMQSDVTLSALSDNGRWALSSDTEDRDEAGVVAAGGRIWNTTDMTSESVSLPQSGVAYISDVTDDGEIIVGSCDGRPAVWTRSTKQWSFLPTPNGASYGQIYAVTPDGKYAVGCANLSSEWEAVPVYYNLETGTIIELKNVPTVNMNNEKSDYSAFTGISADGRYILGRLSPEILSPISMCAYIYDTWTDDVNYIGFTPSTSKPWTPTYDGLLFIEEAWMSPNGRYVTGSAYLGHAQSGSEWLDEYRVAYRYDVTTGKTEILDGVYDSDVMGFSVTDNGVVLAATPAMNPYSSFIVRNGDYYYSLDDILSQVYGIDFYQKTGMSVTGKPALCSADGKTVCVITSQTNSYLLQMADEWADVCSNVNLLSKYSVDPASGSVFSTLSELKVAFNRNVEIAGSASRIKLTDQAGNQLRSAAKAEVNGTVVTISFRSYKFEAGKKYSVTIPAGLISMVGNLNVASDEITIEYVGRPDGSVKPLSVLPADGSSFSRLDATTNPVNISFDASIKISGEVRGELYREGENAPFANLDFALYDGQTLLVYPLTRQYLYEGTTYRVVIPAGAVTDLGGEGGNEEIVLTYNGTYVREISANDKYIFTDDCSTYANFMFYEGDHLTPGSTPAGWGFTADNPWIIIRSSNKTSDMAFAAHSMFQKGGKADDWCVTPQLYIPDTQCYLTFDAQSYKKNFEDRLKVYVFESNNVYSTLNADIINSIRREGILVFDEKLQPGASEETLEDDWVNYNVDLAEFAGKNVYIAFLNENENQSAVFINKVDVIHDMKFLTAITSSPTVVAATHAPVSGTVTIASDLLEANSIDLKLIDNAGNQISSLSETGLNLKKGKSFNFSFPDELPLKPDVSNRFVVQVTVNGTETSSASSSIKNLAFAPVRKVVIEEYSGRECSNCPQGFAAMDNLERLFPGQILPVVLRTYESDPLGQGMHEYTEFLGLNNMGAPSAAINRTTSCYPMVTIGMDYRFSGEGTGTDGGDDAICWLDAVNNEMQTLPDAEIDFTAVYSAGTISVKGNARWALNTEVCNANVLAIVTEDNLSSVQLNGLYSMDDPDLGEWAGNGKYATRYPTVTINGVGRGVAGLTYNGTPGIIPSKLNAGEEYPVEFSISMPETVAVPANTNVIVMMIDGDSDRVINANIAHVTGDFEDSIEEVITDDSNACNLIEFFDIQGRKIQKPTKGTLVIMRNGTEIKKLIY